MLDYFTFSLIIDDIVFPDGQTAMGVLGGGGPQTAFGMKLFAKHVGLAAGIGHNFPPHAQAWLDKMGIDSAAMRRYPDFETLRAWQIMDWDGRRTQVWRTQGPAISAQLALDFDTLPPSYQHARGFHMGVHPEHPNLALLHALKRSGVMVSVEPFRHSSRLLTDNEVRALMEVCHIFSPNLYEARSILGPGQPETLMRQFSEAGAEIVVMRMGEEGALICAGSEGKVVHVPALQKMVADPVGAGNAFCGAFLVGWLETGSLKEAGQWGAVAASFLLEQVGPPPAAADWPARAQERLHLFASTL